jgi:hypothetical protein
MRRAGVTFPLPLSSLRERGFSGTPLPLESPSLHPSRPCERKSYSGMEAKNTDAGSTGLREVAISLECPSVPLPPSYRAAGPPPSLSHLRVPYAKVWKRQPPEEAETRRWISLTPPPPLSAPLFSQLSLPPLLSGRLKPPLRPPPHIYSRSYQAA